MTPEIYERCAVKETTFSKEMDKLEQTLDTLNSLPERLRDSLALILLESESVATLGGVDSVEPPRPNKAELNHKLSAMNDHIKRVIAKINIIIDQIDI